MGLPAQVSVSTKAKDEAVTPGIVRTHDHLASVVQVLQKSKRVWILDTQGGSKMLVVQHEAST